MAGGDSLALIGAGRMGAALVRGWLAGRAKRALHVVEPHPADDITGWAAAGKIALNPAPIHANVVVVAVKPQQFKDSAGAISSFIGTKTLVISIMAGIEIGQLSQRLGTKRVIRAMPNTPGAIGQGVSVVAAPDDARATDITTAKRLLRPLGDVLGPVEEAQMAAVTALSGSGPAYVFLLAEAMAEAGEAEGLPRQLAQALARRTVEGAAALMANTGETPESLRRAVTSPGGTTEAALDILMDSDGMPKLMRRALRAAAQKARDLSRAAD